ncbi:MAG: SEC-C domain-containing protein [Chloroflexota bacterium]
MVFTKDEIENTIFATFSEEDDAYVHDCKLSICGNPLCTCNAVTVKIFPAMEGFISDPIAHLTVDVDTREVDLLLNPEGGISHEEVIHQEDIELLDEEDFQFLLDEYLDYKKHVTQEANMNALDVEFSIEDIEENSTLVGYIDKLPYAECYTLPIDGQKYLFFDQYCVKQGCSCSNVIIDCLRVDEDTNSVEEVAAYTIQYKSRQWELMERNDADLSIVGNPRKLKRMLETTYPMWYKDVRTRHANLKTLYGNYLKTQGIALAPPISRRNVKRNDPCPCGSGRKFKKCCMNK